MLPTHPEARPHPEILLPQHCDDTTQQKLANYAETLRKKNAYCLGFIPAIAYTEAIKRNRLVVELENDEPCGFVLWAKRGSTVRIHQCCIADDARRLRHATQLVTHTLTRPENKNARQLKLRVADDLEANAFWQTIGCQIVANVPGGKTYRRNINLYRLDLRNKAKLATALIDAIWARRQKQLALGRPHSAK